jgi:hypothetical protein
MKNISSEVATTTLSPSFLKLLWCYLHSPQQAPAHITPDQQRAWVKDARQPGRHGNAQGAAAVGRVRRAAQDLDQVLICGEAGCGGAQGQGV